MSTARLVRRVELTQPINCTKLEEMIERVINSRAQRIWTQWTVLRPLVGSAADQRDGVDRQIIGYLLRSCMPATVKISLPNNGRFDEGTFDEFKLTFDPSPKLSIQGCCHHVDQQVNPEDVLDQAVSLLMQIL